MDTAVEAIPFKTPGIVFFLTVSPIVVPCLVLNLQFGGLGGALSPRLTSLTVHPVQREADRKTATLVVPPQTLAGRLLEIAFFVLLVVPFAAALGKWWTGQDADIDWDLVRATAGALLILSVFWLRMRELNAETLEALQKKAKEAIKASQKPPEKTDDHV